MALLSNPLTWERETLTVGGTQLEVLSLGTGQPLLVLHDEMGAPDMVFAAYRDLAQSRRLVLPVCPGFGGSDRLDWMLSVRDLAAWLLQALRALDLGGPVPVLGVSFGGWLAAEMAVMCPHPFTQLALVAPMGLKPPSGEILDLFVITAREYFATWFARPEQIEGFAEQFGDQISPERRARIEDAREAAVRVAWKPYMHDPALPYLLPGVGHPTLIVWGSDDRVVPLSAGQRYAELLPAARLEVIPAAGHRPDLEQPTVFTPLLQRFLQGG